MSDSEGIKYLSVGQVFDGTAYVIPIYQRNYAWKEREITQLIQDIFDYAIPDNSTTTKQDTNYYIGTLIVAERQVGNEIVYETIDGQQRLTTLNIVLSAMHRLFKAELEKPIAYQPNLSFDSRLKSTETLKAIATKEKEIPYLSTKPYNEDIQQAYRDTEKTLKRLLPDKVIRNQYYNFLSKKVQILRVSVPPDTDLNHYFEIMNTRGEQLEKHEILKANLLEVLETDEKLSYTFNLIWEACADMERYVQYGFSVEQRDAVFGKGDWNKFECESLDEIADKVFNEKAKSESKQDLKEGLGFDEILKPSNNFVISEKEKEDAPERFSSVLNFPNFLLHVLRIQTQEDISLDDKRLILLFDEELKKHTDKLAFVKLFGYNLLKCKWLFDSFVIKREFTQSGDRWSLKRLKWYDSTRTSYVKTFKGNEKPNRKILMLLAMFHVSTPTMVYKHWLNAALNYVFQQTEITPQAYANYLQELARAFLFDRYLANKENQSEIEFFDIIFTNKGESKNKGNAEKIDWGQLDMGTDVENFVFNMLDFAIWKKGLSENLAIDTKDFEFATGRSSVEHFYPQNPKNGVLLDQKEHQKFCNRFGNLCLISSSKNSSLSNYDPIAKRNHYQAVKGESLKLRYMMKEADIWDNNAIGKHSKAMIELLKSF